MKTLDHGLSESALNRALKTQGQPI